MPVVEYHLAKGHDLEQINLYTLMIQKLLNKLIRVFKF